MSNELIGQTIAGKYRIEAAWREDRASRTFRATQTLLDKQVLLKILNSDLHDPEAAREFQTSAKQLSRISNPHILNVLDFGQAENGLSFLALENFEGQSLREYLRDNGGLPLPRAVNIVAQVAAALNIAHNHKIVHGDLSSDNILIDASGETVKVLDFAQPVLQNADDEQTLVRGSNALPLYRAPEQFAAGETIDERADVYALGVLLYEILTGKPPFVADSAAALANKHLQEIPPSLIAARPDLPPAMEQTVQRALAKQPNQRFQTVGEFAEALKRAASLDQPETAFAMSNTNFGAIAAQPVAANANANNGYKTAFIVLAGICLLSVAALVFLPIGFRSTPTAAMNADPNSQPAQPINPVSGNAENPADLGLLPDPNANLDPTLVPPGTIPGAPPGTGAPLPEGRIPPGLYPPGQVVTIPGDSQSPFTTDYYPVNVPVNANARPAGNANNAATNANARPAGNTNAAPARPNNANAGGTTTATPAPTAAPTAVPRPQNTPAAKPQPTAAPKSNSNGADEQR